MPIGNNYINSNPGEQYLIAGNTGIKAGQKLASTQQVSTRKLDNKTLNKNLDEMSKFYKKDDSNFSEVSSEKKDEIASEKSVKKEEKKFMLEGTTDIYGSLKESSEEKDAYPTMNKKLFPALDAMEQAVGELGKNPTPEEVDRSNIRRLIRAFQPVAEAFEGSYDKKDFEKSMKKIQKLASSLGKFKDVSVVETELKGISKDGKISPEIQKKLDEHREKQAEEFQETYKDFRKEKMEKALNILRNPESPDVKENKLEEKDRKKLSKSIKGLAEEVDNIGLEHKDPETFHEGRKGLRKLLNAMDATVDTFGYKKEDMESMKKLVNTYGQAQDKYIAYEWLHNNGFEGEANKMLALYEEAQKKALTEASLFMKSGTMERVKKAVE